MGKADPDHLTEKVNMDQDACVKKAKFIQAAVKRMEVKLEKFFGFLTFKYKMHQENSQIQLQNLHYI